MATTRRRTSSRSRISVVENSSCGILLLVNSLKSWAGFGFPTIFGQGQRGGRFLVEEEVERGKKEKRNMSKAKKEEKETGKH